MSDTLSRIYSVLAEEILPSLRSIQASQAEQRLQSERLNQTLAQLCAGIQIRLAEIRADIAACRQEIEDAMVATHDGGSTENGKSSIASKKRLIH
jgi:hypothetical protein